MTLSLDGIDLVPAGGEEAFRSLAAVADRLYRAGDPRAAFAEIYGVITREVAAELASPTCGFLEPDTEREVMAVFCARYFDTLVWSLEGRPQDCQAWQVAYQAAARRSTIPFQDVVLGLQAHINYDLAIGIARVLAARGARGDQQALARFKHDHDHLNVILRGSMGECFERLCTRHGCRFSGVLWQRPQPVTARLVLSVLTSWRERVWTDVLRLLEADREEERRAIIAAMDRRSGRIARAVVAPSAAYVTGERLLPRRLASAIRATWLADRDPTAYLSL
ncbi:MAG TPA: DUF5995 family protein [Kofleriaceae bacterium]|nr:DUF5995 family protein [Kofleriaceae bacterium]